MTPLIQLSQDQRLQISSQCESFFLQIKINDNFRELYNNLIILTSKRNSKELWCFITACCKAIRYDSVGSQLTLDRKNYSTANKIHKRSISQKRMIDLLEDLEKHNLIDMYTGYSTKDFSMMSCFIMKDRLIEIIPVVASKQHSLERNPNDYIQIKNYLTGQLVDNHKGFKGIGLLKMEMTEYNSLLERQIITIDNRKVNVCYKRVFADNLNSAGRFYSMNGFINENSNLRQTIKINDNSVTEIDLCSLHPRIYYTLLGIKLAKTWEPYNIEQGVVRVYPGGEHQARVLCKIAMMCILYAKNVRGAISAVIDKITKDRVLPVDKQSFNLIDMNYKGSYSRLIDALIEHNKEISSQFFKEDGWKKLQHIDSRLCSKVLKDFTEKGLTCLPYHDSWVVEEHNQDLLIDSMRSSWRSVFGTTLNFKYSVEF